MAAFLDIPVYTLPGLFTFYIDDVTGDAMSMVRHGLFNGASIDIAAVPEPASILLMSAAISLATIRCRTHRGRRTRPL